MLKTYIEHVRRHWLYFFLAVVAGLAAAWLLLNFAQRAARPTAPAPASIILALTAFPPRH